MDTPTTLTINDFPQGDASRARRLFDEFRDAVSKLDKNELKQFSSKAVKIGGAVTLRRFKNLGKASLSLGKSLFYEIIGAISVIRKGHGAKYALFRAGSVVTISKDTVISCYRIVGFIIETVKADPKKEAPKLLAFTLGLTIASGGSDGDGGIPDLDLLGGIGRHRSIFTHTIIAGIAVETATYMIADLVTRIHRHLPENHDPLWDSINSQKDEILQLFAIGASMGLAYHFMIDGTLQNGGTFKGLPFHLPQVGHNAILWGSAATEGLDAAARLRYTNLYQEILSETKCNPSPENNQEEGSFSLEKP